MAHNNDGQGQASRKRDAAAAESPLDTVMKAIKGDTAAVAEVTSRSDGDVISAGSTAPLQLKRPHKPKPQGLPVTSRFIRFLRRNVGFVAVGVFVYVEFIGFPVLKATSKDKERVVAIRKRWNHEVAASRAYAPPVREEFVTRRGAFSLTDNGLLPEVDSVSEAPIERPPYTTRVYNYLASFLPNPFYGSIDSSQEGRNTLQYNRLLYFPQVYSWRKTTLIPIDAITADGRVAVHAAVKVLYRTELIRNPRPMWRHHFVKVGEADAMLDNIAANEIEKWIKGALEVDIRHAPVKRVHSDVHTLGGMTEVELRQSVLDSAEEWRKLREREVAGEEESIPAVVDETKRLDDAETLRRIWATNITSRLRGRVIIEDITWKLTLTELRQGPDPRRLDPTIADNWVY